MYTYLQVYYAKSTGYRLGTSKLGAFSDDHVRRTVDHERIKINIINTEKRFTIKIKVNISVSNMYTIIMFYTCVFTGTYLPYVYSAKMIARDDDDLTMSLLYKI